MKYLRTLSSGAQSARQKRNATKQKPSHSVEKTQPRKKKCLKMQGIKKRYNL